MERRVSVAASYNPTPTTPLGCTARVSPGLWGGESMSDADALWGGESVGGIGGYSGGSGTRNPEEVEHRFRRKWNSESGKWNTESYGGNSESGKWNTESGGSGTSIPEEVEQRFRRS